MWYASFVIKWHFLCNETYDIQNETWLNFAYICVKSSVWTAGIAPADQILITNCLTCKYCSKVLLFGGPWIFFGGFVILLG